MDQKFWFKFKPYLTIKKMHKMVLGRFTHKIVIIARGGAVLKDKQYLETFGLLSDYLANRNRYSFLGKTIRPKVMMALYKVYTEFLEQNKIELRVEEPRLTFYFDNEDDLKSFAIKIPKSLEIKEVCGPSNESEYQALKSNMVIRSKHIDYAYCVTFKPGVYTEEDKKIILTLINNLGAKATDSFIHKMTRTNHHPNIWTNHKIYIKTEADYTWMRLSLKSNLVGKINQLHFTNK